MSDLLRAYRFLNMVSIDVACGAAVCGHFFSGIFQVEQTAVGLLSLGLTVWIIYTVDHLMDALSMSKEAATARHRLHQRHFALIAFLLIAALIADGALILHMEAPIVKGGLVLGAMVGVYLVVHRYVHPFKELMVAVLYTGGVMLPALSMDINPTSIAVILLVVAFCFTALINLLLFSWFECEMDLMDRRESIVSILGKTNTRRLIGSLFLGQSVILLDLFMKDSQHSQAGVLAIMNGVLLIIFIFPGNFWHEDRHRLVGDSVFLVPLIQLFWNA